MPGETHNRRPGLVSTLCSGLIAVGFLLLVTHLPSLTLTPRSGAGDSRVSSAPRQRVVIFIVDTSDYFDAHGTYVQSVIRQHCSRCEVRQINLHGDLSLPTISQALHHVREVSQGFDGVITTLVNLSFGTYTYDKVLHAVVRSLDAQGVLIIASAGNDNTAKPFYPAAFKEVLGICSSTRYTRTKAAYSNFGSWVSLCAPGLQYVTRPQQREGLASGTSFASPMVTGVLGQLLLDAPCATSRIGIRALQRTADDVVKNQPQLGAGLLNSSAAAHYLRSLYACQDAEGFLQRLLARAQHLGTGVLTYLGLIVYFIISVFAFPFLLAFVLEKVQHRAVQRQQHAIQLAYTNSPDYRRQRLLAIKQRFQHTQKVRRRDQAEFYALLHALHIHREPCWWCDKAEPEQPCDDLSQEDIIACSRCGMALHESVPLS